MDAHEEMIASQLGDEPDNAIEEERYLLKTLAMLQESYAKAAKPYIDRIAMIHSYRKPEPLFVTIEQAQAMGFEVPNAD